MIIFNNIVSNRQYYGSNPVYGLKKGAIPTVNPYYIYYYSNVSNGSTYSILRADMAGGLSCVDELYDNGRLATKTTKSLDELDKGEYCYDGESIRYRFFDAGDGFHELKFTMVENMWSHYECNDSVGVIVPDIESPYPEKFLCRSVDQSYLNSTLILPEWWDGLEALEEYGEYPNRFDGSFTKLVFLNPSMGFADEDAITDTIDEIIFSFNYVPSTVYPDVRKPNVTKVWLPANIYNSFVNDSEWGVYKDKFLAYSNLIIGDRNLVTPVRVNP